VEQTNEISNLQHHISVQRARINELEAEVAESEVRRKRSAANTAGGGRSLRDSEDQFHREERLRDDLELAKRQKLELEAALLDRDARAIESKFDLEASELEAERLTRRVKELEHAYKSLSALTQQGPLKGAAAGMPGAAPGASMGGGKKEQELEGTIEAMRRVIEKLKAENDRLKKGSGGSEDRRFTDLERKYQVERKRVEQLEAEAQAVQVKMKGLEDSGLKVVERQQQVALLRKQLKTKTDEVGSVRAEYERALAEKGAALEARSKLQDRINELEIALHKATNARGGQPVTGAADREGQDLRRQVAAHVSENDNLRLQVNELRKTVQQLQAQAQQAATGAGGGAAGRGARGGEGAVNPADYRRLEEENAKLRSELSAFDMDFFQEIEDLKFAHAEAVRKLRFYESGGGAAGAGGGSPGRGRRVGGLRT
jgi:chromosome segregation ATPase